MVSMKDIAQRCGVSVATVSKALNDQPDIGAETREKIHKVAAEMGYCSGAHFSKKFREATGNTPAEYRRQQMYLTARRQNRQQKDIDEP